MPASAFAFRPMSDSNSFRRRASATSMTSYLSRQR